jgi:nicotinate-nucleotide pyrophosphorylase (carboxylating)
MKGELLSSLLRLAYQEDIYTGDVSAESVFEASQQAHAKAFAKEKGIVAGMYFLPEICAFFDPNLQVIIHCKDGEEVYPENLLWELKGSTISILGLERTLLNIVQRMSGIATYTKFLTSLLNDSSITLLDTRKTTPGFRLFEKKAVEIGGGKNHRFGLYDMVMLKDNHIDFSGGISPAVAKVQAYLKRNGKSLGIEVETRTLDEVKEVLSLEGIQRIMLDNFSLDQVKEAVSLINNRLEIEVSGGINETTLPLYKGSGVHFISIGALTHSYKSLDISLKAEIC